MDADTAFPVIASGLSLVFAGIPAMLVRPDNNGIQ